MAGTRWCCHEKLDLHPHDRAASVDHRRRPGPAVSLPHFYPTSYFDHSSQDWDCQSFTYTNHRGSDYGVGSWAGMAAGQDVVAAADGVVTATHDGEDDQCSTGDCPGGGGYGNHVYVQHPDGKVTRYAHFKQWTVAVAVNDVVSCGDLLGEVGSSGYSTGPHLHFEVRNSSNTAVDPFHGTCSSGASLWVSQSSYMGVPEAACETAVCGVRLLQRGRGSHLLSPGLPHLRARRAPGR